MALGALSDMYLSGNESAPRPAPQKRGNHHTVTTVSPLRIAESVRRGVQLFLRRTHSYRLHSCLNERGKEIAVKTWRIALGLLGLFSATVCGAESSFGDWQAGVTDDRSTMYAYTTNDSGDMFGEWCSVTTGNCTWMLGLTTACEQESSYPVLANTDTGAAPLNIKCGGKIEDSELSRYQFTSFKDVEKLLKGGHRVGIALPMQGDQFRVVRFSLKGSSAATSAMEAAVAKLARPQQKKDTRDVVL